MKNSTMKFKVMIIVGIIGLISGVLFSLISPQIIYKSIQNQISSSEDFEDFVLLDIYDSVVVEQPIVVPGDKINSIAIFFENCSAVSKGLVRVEILDNSLTPCYEYIFKPSDVEAETFCLITESVYNIKKGETYKLNITTEGISDGEIIKVRSTKDMVNKEHFLPLNYSGIEKNETITMLVDYQYFGSLKKGSLIFFLFCFLSVAIGCIINLCIYLMSKIGLRIKIHNSPKSVCFGVVFCIILLVAFYTNPNIGKKTDEVKFFSYNRVLEFQPLILSETGEVQQAFVAKTDRLNSFILIYDNIRNTDTGELYAVLEDENKQVYYLWEGSIRDLAINDGDNSYYLMASVEQKLNAGENYYIRTGIRNADSKITLRSSDSEQKENSIRDLKTESNGVLKGALYMGCTYLNETFPAFYIIVLALIFFSLLYMKIHYKGKEVKFVLIPRLIIFASPCIMYLLFEYINGNLFLISFPCLFINIFIVYIFYFIIYFIYSSLKSIILLNVFLYVFAIINYFVSVYRGDSIKIWDFFAIGTVSTVIKNYSLYFTSEMLIGLEIILIINLLCINFVFVKKLRIKEKVVGLLCTSGLSFILFFVLLKFALTSTGAINFFSLEENYKTKGYFYTTAILLDNMTIKKPDNYSEKFIKEITEGILDSSSIREEEVSPDNIIIIMNESFSDLQSIKNFETNKPVMPFINSLNENTTKGKLYVPTYGGQTARTEYEVLTGNTSHFLPIGSVAYQTICKENEKGLCSILKEQGFKTVAIHPFGGKNWNRENVYSFMGFDDFLTIEDFEGYPTIRNYVSDLGNYQKVIECYENKKPGEKLFVFNVTMQNHGGYDIDNGSLEENIYALNGNNRVANCYLSLINESDNALKYLIDYFLNQDENTMIVFFGDHLPALSDRAYQDLMGESLEVLKKDIEMYQTPFFIWTNYNLEVRNIDYISSNYLGSIILDEANLQLPVYQQYLLNLYQAIPVIGYQGCFDYEGNFYSYNDLPSKLQELLDQYECMQYNHIKY